MTHLDELTAIQRHLAQQEYGEVVALGRAELSQGRDSSRLLIQMATAVLLGCGTEGSLKEARDWLHRATVGDPGNLEAWIEWGHFLDAVADEPDAAAAAFERAIKLALEYLEAALNGLDSVGVQAGARNRVSAALTKALSELSLSSRSA